MIIKNISDDTLEFDNIGFELAADEERTLEEIANRYTLFSHLDELVRPMLDGKAQFIDNGQIINEISIIANYLKTGLTAVTLNQQDDSPPLSVEIPDEITVANYMDNDGYYYFKNNYTLLPGKEYKIQFSGFLKTIFVSQKTGKLTISVNDMGNIEVDETSEFTFDIDYKLKDPVLKLKSDMIAICEIFIEGIYVDTSKSKDQYLKELHINESTTDVSNISDTRELIFDCEFDSKYLSDNVFIDNVNNITGLVYNLSSTYNDDNTFRDGMYVDFGEILNIDEDKEFTFSFWVNLETVDGRQDIIKNAFNYYFYLHNKSFYFYDYFNKSTKVLSNVESDKWYNIIIMYSKHRWRVYVNGEIVYNRLTRIKLKPSKLYVSTSAHPFNGKITYMKVYNYAFSTSMIKYLINHNNPNIINDIANEYENGFRCNVYDCLSVINPPATNYELLLAEKKYANHANLTNSLESDNIVVNIESTVPRIELIVAEGYIQMPDSGLYTIALNSNSICDFEIDEQSIISWSRDDLATDSYNNSVTKYFSEGYYKYKIRYFKIQGDTEFSLGWKTPSSDTSDIVDIPKDNLYRVKIVPDTIGQFGSYNGDAYGCSSDSSFNDTLAAEVEDSTHNYYNINNLKILRYKDLTNFNDQQIFTFNFWTKINSNYAYLFAIGNQNWRDYLSGYYTNKRLIFDFQGTKLDSGVDIINQWVMISVTGNGTQITAYLNGNEIAQIEQRENDWFKYLPKFVNFGTASSGTPYRYMSMNDFSLGDWFFDTKAYVKNDLINLYSKTKQYYT